MHYEWKKEKTGKMERMKREGREKDRDGRRRQ
jgi:hypothetical protein